MYLAVLNDLWKLNFETVNITAIQVSNIKTESMTTTSIVTSLSRLFCKLKTILISLLVNRLQKAEVAQYHTAKSVTTKSLSVVNIRS